ncbi:MAG: [FeFe] hydrogenase H-cluster radical SAM maturase HydE [Desulfobulbus sp.]|nr:[FeFe] hydrogenase H-cluster radical SAM maturase HydE [Desulfobulbus sp.]
MDRREVLHWLRSEETQELQQLWNRADAVRREHVGEAVHLRGLVEISNFCARSCHYCGLRAGNRQVSRYRLAAQDILQCAQKATQLGYGTLVLQSGEDDLLEAEWLADILRRLKATTPLAITLSLGERSEDDLRTWKNAGADRYLLRFETSDRALYRAIHPDRGAKVSDRVALLRQLQHIGYEIGSGVMVGIPGQSDEILADDILLFHQLDLDMIGIGPFIAHQDTPLGRIQPKTDPLNQVEANIEMTCKAVALARILCPDANIPATTAVAVKDAWQGREMALRRGANVIMPNLTPGPFRELYSIYPGKADRIEVADQSDRQIRAQIIALGRTVGEGQGGRKSLRPPAVQDKNAILRIAVCMGSSCFSRGNNGRVVETLQHCAESAGFKPEIVGHLCENQCTQGPHITIEDTLYSNVQPACFPELLKHHLSVRREE